MHRFAGIDLMKSFFALLLVGFLSLLAHKPVMALVPIPALTGHIVDLTGSLSASEIQQLDQGLQDFEAQKGSQVAVLILPSTAPEAIEQYSLRVVDQWKLGRKKSDDGVLLLIAKEDRALRIEVGYGLEGAITDITSNRIINEIITPRLRGGDFYGAVQAGVGSIVRLIQGEALPPPPKGRRGQGQGDRAGAAHGGLGSGALIAAIMGSLFLRTLFGRIFGGVLAGGLVGGIATFMLGSFLMGIGLGIAALFFVLVSGHLGGIGGVGGMGSGNRGGFGGGGFGGGGFGGGGGGFGGGGASGRW